MVPKIVGVVAETSRDSATTHACLRLRPTLEMKRSRRFLMDMLFGGGGGNFWQHQTTEQVSKKISIRSKQCGLLKRKLTT